MPTPTRPSDYEFANDLTFRQANDLKAALTGALDAMASYGSDEDQMATLSLLLVVATKQQADGFKRREAAQAVSEVASS